MKVPFQGGQGPEGAAAHTWMDTISKHSFAFDHKAKQQQTWLPLGRLTGNTLS